MTAKDGAFPHRQIVAIAALAVSIYSIYFFLKHANMAASRGEYFALSILLLITTVGVKAADLAFKETLSAFGYALPEVADK